MQTIVSKCKCFSMAPHIRSHGAPCSCFPNQVSLQLYEFVVHRLRYGRCAAWPCMAHDADCCYTCSVVCLSVCEREPCRTGWRNEFPLGVWTRAKGTVLDGSAYWRHMRGSDAALCPITLTTCCCCCRAVFLPGHLTCSELWLSAMKSVMFLFN